MRYVVHTTRKNFASPKRGGGLPNAPVGGDEDVSRLDIAVNLALGMQVHQRLCDSGYMGQATAVAGKTTNRKEGKNEISTIWMETNLIDSSRKKKKKKRTHARTGGRKPDGTTKNKKQKGKKWRGYQGKAKGKQNTQKQN